MVNPERIPEGNQGENVELEGFDQFFFEGEQEYGEIETATTGGEAISSAQMEKLLDRVSELVTLSVDQRLESSKISNQLLENQRQLIATQQILIKLMERSIELTRHVTSIEERLPALFELPRVVESLRERIIELEGVETR